MKEPVELHEDIARSLRMLGQVSPPEGMEARIARRMRQRQAELSAHPVAKRAWGWGLAVPGVIAVAAAVLLSYHRAGTRMTADRVVAVAPQRAVPSPATVIARADARVPVTRVVRPVRVARVVRKRAMVAEIPHSPPPLPLTPQEHLLLALARTPSLLPSLAGVTRSETVVDHGLGQNSIFELDHQNLTQMEPAHFTPLKPMPPGELK